MKEKTNKGYIAAIVILAVCLAAALIYIATSKASPQKEQTAQPSLPPATVPTEGEVLPPDRSMMTIETEYGELTYPAAWKDYLRTEQKREGNNLKVTFSADCGGALYELFVVTIGELDDTVLGVVKDTGGVSRNVYVSVSDLPDLSALDEQSQNTVFAMQEGVNELIEGLGQ